MEYKILIDNVDMTEYVPLPITEQLTLDESLDMGMVRLLYTNLETPFQPLTSVNIKITSDTDERILYYFVSSDEVTEVIQVGKYNHTIMLIEQTKWLERFIGRTKTVTNPLVREFEQKNVYVSKYVKQGDKVTNTVEENTNYVSPMINGQQVSFPSVNTYFNKTQTPQQALLEVRKNGAIVQYTTDYQKSITITLTGGIYDIRYEWSIRPTASSEEIRKDNFQITSITDKSVQDKTITEVVNSVLATIETLRESETPRFSFNSEQATQYSQVNSPEFTLTGTLWEQLSTIGEYIHSIPRLRNNVIYFDELGVNEYIDKPLSDYVSSVKKFDIEQFALSLDSNVDNFMNTESSYGNLGLTEPFNSGFKTVRTDATTVKMTEDNIHIETKYPIEKILGVWCGYISGETNYIGDITKYVYEESEYLTLSSYGGAYPLSKGFALKYTTGKNNITELDFKLPNEFNPIFSDYAIVNIIQDKIGKKIGEEEIMKLQFEVRYIPVISGRVKQSKSYIGDIKTNSSLAYNQTAQKISSIAYGEALKGAIARLGNPEISRVYILEDVSLIPEVGKRFDDDYYVSAVKCEYYKDFIRCEVVLSKNFNKLNEYVGIKNDVRFYEISERQAVDSQILYEDYCVIGDDFRSDNKAILTDINSFALSLTNNQHNYAVAEIAEVTGYSQGVALDAVVLPVTSYSLGNSLLFNFRYNDSFSAGNSVVQQGVTRVQYQVPYTNERGEIDSLKIKLGNTIFDADNYSEAVAKGDLFPHQEVIANNPNNNWVFDTGDDKIVILKDNREIPTFNYQLHFVTNNKNLIIGKYFTEINTFITPNYNNKRIVLLLSKIDKFQDFTPSVVLTVPDYTLTATVNGNTVDMGEFNVPSINTGSKELEFYGWALVDGDDRIFLAELFPNKLKAGDVVKLPKFTFTHKIL